MASIREFQGLASHHPVSAFLNNPISPQRASAERLGLSERRALSLMFRNDFSVSSFYSSVYRAFIWVCWSRREGAFFLRTSREQNTHEGDHQGKEIKAMSEEFSGKMIISKKKTIPCIRFLHNRYCRYTLYCYCVPLALWGQSYDTMIIIIIMTFIN